MNYIWVLCYLQKFTLPAAPTLKKPSLTLKKTCWVPITAWPSRARTRTRTSPAMDDCPMTASSPPERPPTSRVSQNMSSRSLRLKLQDEACLQSLFVCIQYSVRSSKLHNTFSLKSTPQCFLVPNGPFLVDTISFLFNLTQTSCITMFLDKSFRKVILFIKNKKDKNRIVLLLGLT